ncbi:MAG: hypothetical protein Tsb0015_01500 [Simkaniaceae bacterium]
MKKSNLLLFYKTGCPYCEKVLTALKKMGKDIPKKNISEDPSAKEELKEKGGKVQVPCLFINDSPLYESDDIIHWLEENKSLL